MSWIYYLLEANLYLTVFYFLYYLIFSRETYYQLNRIYLLGSTLLAFLIPVMQIGALNPPAPHLHHVVTTIHSQIVYVPVKEVADTSWPIINYFLLTYAIVVLLLMINFLIKIYKLIRLSYANKIAVHADFKLVELHSENSAFSFFNYLFINPGLTLSSTVIHHELIHIKQKHSWDIVYLELLKIINWFNPVVYLLQNSIKEVHEFIADNYTVGDQQNIAVYTDLLINNAYGINENTLTNTFFNKNLLKKRIIMLHQKRSGNAARLKYLLVLPLTLGLLCASTLAFAKSYAWINLLPAKNQISVQQKDTVTSPHSPIPPVDVKAPKVKLKNPPPLPVPPVDAKAPRVKLKNPPPPPVPPVDAKAPKNQIKITPPPPPAEIIIYDKDNGKIIGQAGEAHTILYGPSDKQGENTIPLIIVNGQKYNMKEKLKPGQYLYITASDSTVVNHQPGIDAKKKWGSEADNGIIELYGKTSIEVK